ncbi:hypothetical protein WMY93_013812 [Mugilogobius chulae]|uniref:Uncharacterized protein n=1 Tax=Mugilogobius chulae TaxID=88201 RepID=A0AAW0P7D1_9GOBI
MMVGTGQHKGLLVIWRCGRESEQGMAYAHVLLSLRNDGEVRTKEGDYAGTHLARTFHRSSRESHQSKAREHHATGAAAAISKAAPNSTRPWGKVKETRKPARKSGNNKLNLNRTVTTVEDANAASNWDPTRQHNNKRIKLNGGLSGGSAGGHYNAPKAPTGLMDEEGGDRRKSVSKEESPKKAVPKKGKTRRNKSEIVSAQAFWEPMPKPVALTSTDLPFDLFTRRTDYFYTFRGEDNPWDATPMTPRALWILWMRSRIRFGP